MSPETESPVPFEAKGYDLRIAAEVIGIGLTKTRELVADKELDSYRVGRRVLVTGRAILDYQRKQGAAS